MIGFYIGYAMIGLLFLGIFIGLGIMIFNAVETPEHRQRRVHRREARQRERRMRNPKIYR